MALPSSSACVTFIAISKKVETGHRPRYRRWWWSRPSPCRPTTRLYTYLLGRRAGVGRAAGGRPVLPRSAQLHRRDRGHRADPRDAPSTSTCPALYNALGVFLPLITVNCAIMGWLAVHGGARLQPAEKRDLRPIGSGFLGAGDSLPAGIREKPGTGIRAEYPKVRPGITFHHHRSDVVGYCVPRRQL